MDPPIDCPKEVGDIMVECWNHNPEQRPTFTVLLDKLQAAYLTINT